MEENKPNSTLNTKNALVIDPLFKSLADNIPHVLHFVDPTNYTIQYINKLSPGFTLDNVIGRNMLDFVSPEYIELYKQKLLEIKTTGIPSIIEVEGSSRDTPNAKSFYRTQISLIKTPENKTSSIMFLSEDITEQKNKANDIINQSERIKAIINNTIDVICSIDRDYNLLEFNSVLASRVKSGFKIDLKPGMALLQFIDPKKSDHLKAIYQKVLNGETCYDIEKFEITNYNPIHFESSYNPIYNADKIVVGISIFSKDITERIKNDQKIIAALKEKEILLAEIHHRIKNNLAMVSSLLELKEMNISNEEAKEALTSSRKRVKSTALIHELLYKSESFQNINFKDYLTELFQYLKSNDNIQLSLIGDDVTFNLSTALPLGLMLNEIMLNSFKHSYKDAKEGKTEIQTLIEGDILTINYCDCKGEFPDFIDFKNSNSTGLTLIQTFAEQLNGKIDLISKNPPKYKILLPINGTQ